MMNNRKNRCAFLLTHGTDTMAWALSYLTYALKNNPHPVALVGSQRPMTKQFSSSDGYSNVELAVEMLLEMEEPVVFCAFNDGKDVFVESLWKIDKWDEDAFYGKRLLSLHSNEKINFQNIYTSLKKIDILYILRTGGTIEATHENGIVKPSKPNDATSIFIKKEFVDKRKVIIKVESREVSPRDSSDMNFNIWKEIAKEIAELSKKNNYYAKADTKFEEKIPIIFASPLLKEDDYYNLLDANRYPGAIFVGYGAGNINIKEEEGYSPLKPMREYAKKGGIFVITSHAVQGILDSIYENSQVLYDEGIAFPSLNFSLAHSQVKLSYILGHKKEIKDAFKEDFKRILSILFLSGGKFANPESKKYFEKKLGIRIPEEDLLINKSFETSLAKSEKYLTKNEKVSKKFIDLSDKECEKAAVIIKPDEIVGENKMGVPIDASNSLKKLLNSAFEWDVYELNLWEIIKQKNIIDKLKNLSFLFWEGGNPSVYDPKSFKISKENPESLRNDYIKFFKKWILLRSENKNIPPSIFICLSHQMLAQALLEIIEELINKSLDIIPKNLQASYKEFKTKWNGFKQKYKLNNAVISMGKNKEMDLIKLEKFKLPNNFPPEVKDAYLKISKSFSGILDAILPSEPIEVNFLHGDEVDYKTLIFINWALQEFYKIRVKGPDEYKEIFPVLPLGLEITSSNYNKKGEINTEVASYVIYYLNQNGYFYKDFSFQFHPELIGYETIRTFFEGEKITVDFKNDGVKILIASIMAAKEKMKLFNLFK